MEISVVVTFYFQDNTIVKAVESFLKQDVSIKEIIVVDDGNMMKEDTKNILESYKYVTVYGIQHKGVSGARNYGIQKASSEYVFVADGDDVYDPTLIRKLESIMCEDSIVGVSSWLSTQKKGEIILKACGGKQKDFLCINDCPGQILIRKNEWIRCGGYDENMVCGYEDWEFYIRITEGNREIAIYPEALITYNFPKRKADKDYLENRIKWKVYILQKHYEKYKENLLYVISEGEKAYLNRMSNVLDLHKSIRLGDGSIEALNMKFYSK